MSPAEQAFIDNQVDAFKAALLEIGYLKRLSNAQRTALAKAHRLVFEIPVVLHGEHPLKKYVKEPCVQTSE